jgi:hypothetical protein
MSHWIEKLIELHACEAAVTWAETQPDLATAWANCERADWMLWLAGRVAGPIGDPRRIPLALATADCADTVPQGATGAECLRVLRAWTRGGATIEEVRVAHRAAAYAAAAYAADAFTTYAADAAYATFAANAADAAYVTLAANAANAADAAREKALRGMCDIIRKHYPEPPVLS